MQLEFNWKYEDYELRAVPKCLARFEESDINQTIELVKWYYDEEDDRKHCFTLAYWVLANEGYELRFVSDRMFKYITEEDIRVVWEHLKNAQEVLNQFELDVTLEEFE